MATSRIVTLFESAMSLPYQFTHHLICNCTIFLIHSILFNLIFSVNMRLYREHSLISAFQQVRDDVSHIGVPLPRKLMNRFSLYQFAILDVEMHDIRQCGSIPIPGLLGGSKMSNRIACIKHDPKGLGIDGLHRFNKMFG